MHRRGLGQVHDDVGPCLSVMISNFELDMTLKSGQGASLDAPERAVLSRTCRLGVREPSTGSGTCPVPLPAPQTSAGKISRHSELIRFYSVHVSVGESKRRSLFSEPRRRSVWAPTPGRAQGRPQLRVGGGVRGEGSRESGDCGKCLPWGHRPRTAVSSMILFLFGGLRVTRGCRACHMSCITGIL